MAAKQIIILDVKEGPGGDRIVHCIGWYPVPVGKEMTTTIPSVWPGATTAENNAILAGQVIEEEYYPQYSTSLGLAAIKAALQNIWTARNSQIQARLTAFNPKQFFGNYWDGTGWF